jgi:hypothetical protein
LHRQREPRLPVQLIAEFPPLFPLPDRVLMDPDFARGLTGGATQDQEPGGSELAGRQDRWRGGIGWLRFVFRARNVR